MSEPAIDPARLWSDPLTEAAASTSGAGEAMRIEVAEPDALPRIHALERIEGYDRFVGHWSLEKHAAEMRLPTSRYLLGTTGGEAVGFALLQGIGEGDACILIKRILVSRPGEGLGKALLAGVLHRCFEAYGAHRVDLRVFTDNHRAQRAYRAAGFVREGILRDASRSASGEFRSVIVMSILEGEWRR